MLQRTVDSALHPWIINGQKLKQGYPRVCRIQVEGAERLDECTDFLIVAMCKDLFTDTVPCVAPPPYVTRQSVLFREMDCPIERYPCHNFRIRKMARLTPHLPYPLIRLRPYRADMISGIAEKFYDVRLRCMLAPSRQLVCRVHDLAVDPELQLFRCAVSDADRTRATVSLKAVFSGLHSEPRPEHRTKAFIHDIGVAHAA